jgi:hypothetical protein
MCRPKELGGRRCPQHTDPVKHAAYNARRRELYAASKNTSSLPSPVEFSSAIQYEHLFVLEDKNTVETIEKTFKGRLGYIAEGNALYDALQEQDDSEKLRKSLLYYTSHGYTDLRKYLNASPEDKEDFDDEAMDDLVNDLDKSISLAETKREYRAVYRGIRVDETVTGEKSFDVWLHEAFPIDGVVSQKSYMSTSLSPAKAINIFGFGSVTESLLFEIVTKRGAALNEKTSVMGTKEYEILLPREAKFRVVNVQKDITLKLHSSPGDNALVHPIQKTVVQLIDVTDEES